MNEPGMMTGFAPTLEQQFELRQMQDAAKNLPREHLEEMLLQAARLIMVKDNIIKAMIKNDGVLF